jgi:hypothetical protein
MFPFYTTETAIDFLIGQLMIYCYNTNQVLSFHLATTFQLKDKIGLSKILVYELFFEKVTEARLEETRL